MVVPSNLFSEKFAGLFSTLSKCAGKKLETISSKISFCLSLCQVTTDLGNFGMSASRDKPYLRFNINNSALRLTLTTSENATNHVHLDADNYL